MERWTGLWCLPILPLLPTKSELGGYSILDAKKLFVVTQQERQGINLSGDRYKSSTHAYFPIPKCATPHYGMCIFPNTQPPRYRKCFAVFKRSLPLIMHIDAIILPMMD